MEQEYNNKQQLILENVRTILEKVLMELNPKLKIHFHRQYLAGYIDCLHDCGHIDDEIREIVYLEYAC